MHIALKPWELSDAASLMSLCNRVDRSFLSDRIPFSLHGRFRRRMAAYGWPP